MEPTDLQKYLDIPPVEFEKLYAEIGNEGEAQSIASQLERAAMRFVLLAEYLDSRAYGMQDHKHAAKLANKTHNKVRKALGFSYPLQLEF